MFILNYKLTVIRKIKLILAIFLKKSMQFIITVNIKYKLLGGFRNNVSSFKTGYDSRVNQSMYGMY